MNKSQGAALVVVLLIAAIATSLVTGLFTEQYYNVKRQQHIQTNTQSWIYVIGLEKWSVKLLQDDEDKKIDGGDDNWVSGISPTKVEIGEISSSIVDLQGKFNINNLIDDNKVNIEQLKIFKRLLIELDVSITLTDAIIDWLDSDSDTTFPEGAEDTYYQTQNPPNRSANRKIDSINELIEIKGLDAEVFSKLKWHITALPEFTKINLNTANAVVLSAMLDELSESDIDYLIKKRDANVIKDLKDFFDDPIVKEKRINTDIMSLNSSYFGIISQVKSKNRILSVFTKAHREENKVNVLSRNNLGIVTDGKI